MEIAAYIIGYFIIAYSVIVLIFIAKEEDIHPFYNIDDPGAFFAGLFWPITVTVIGFAFGIMGIVESAQWVAEWARERINEKWK